MKSAANKLIVVGRATMLTVGLAVSLALIMGLATAALAAVPGDPLKLGQANVINALTRMAGSSNQSLLRIDNNSNGPDATALDLQVEPGKAPMKVNSTTEVQGLNVDSLDSKNSSDFLGDDQTAANSTNLDGKDSTAFFSGDNYKDSRIVSGNPNEGNFATISCDSTDAVLSGGYGEMDAGSHVTESEPDTGFDGWRLSWTGDSQVRVSVLCADFPPLK